jgi:hypothetical protein
MRVRAKRAPLPLLKEGQKKRSRRRGVGAAVRSAVGSNVGSNEEYGCNLYPYYLVSEYPCSSTLPLPMLLPV